MNIGQKVIQDYVLGQTVRSLPNGISLMRAKHVKSGKEFMIKKASILIEEPNAKERIGEELILRQLEALRQLNLQDMVKCIKLIKTKRNVYSVFEKYPSHQLTQYLSSFEPTLFERLRFGQIICQTLIKIHEKGLIFGNLHPNCVLIDHQTSTPKLIGLEHLSHINKNEQISFEPTHEFVAPQVKKTRRVSFASDGYSFGKILQLMGISSMKTKELQVATPLENIIQSLTSILSYKRPSLQTVYMCLQIKGSQDQITEITDVSFQQEKKKKVISVRPVKSDYTPKKPRTRSTQKKALQNKTHLKRANRIKEIMKVRNFNLYLFNLAHFCLKKQDLQLCFLLLKKAIIAGTALLQGLKSDPLTLKDNLEQLVQVLISEHQYQRQFFEKIASKVQNTSLLASELKNEESVDESILEMMMLKFMRKNRKKIKETKTNFHSEDRKMILVLYQFSEKFHYGTFEKFFHQSFSEESFDLQEQKYLKYLNIQPNKQLVEKIDSTIK